MFFVIGFKEGKRALKKGYFSGIKIGLYLLIFSFIINIFLSQKVITFSQIIYYFILLLCSALGGMVGISTKKES